MEANNQKAKGKKPMRTEVKFIENKQERLISFSKRRSGIFKKANELVTMCGGEVAVVVYSPAGRAFSFGHPSMEAVASRFLGTPIEPEKGDGAENLSEEQRKEKMEEMNKVHSEMMRQLEEQKKQDRMMKKLVEEGSTTSNDQQEERLWWMIPNNELNKEQLRDAHYRLREIFGIVMNKMEQKNKNKAQASRT